MKKAKNNGKIYVLLHILLLVFSFSSVFLKYAAKYEFLSFNFCLFFALAILVMGIYAILWQQILKKLPLSTAFSNKAITVIWGLIWGLLFFGEAISVNMIIGAIVVLTGVVIVARSSDE